MVHILVSQYCTSHSLRKHSARPFVMDLYVTAKRLWILCSLLSTVLATGGQLKLEDIERDTLNSESYVQQQQQNQAKNFQELPPPQYFVTPRPETFTGPHQFAPDARQFNVQPQPQDVLQSTPLQFLQELAAGAQQQQQYPYVPDNSVQQYTPQYYTQSPPQQQQAQKYLYVPQNPPQNGLKLGIQYADPNTEYLRNPQIHSTLLKQHETSHNLAGLIQRTAYTNVLPPNYRQPAPQTYRLSGLAAQQYVNQNVYVLPQPTATRTLQPAHPLYQRTNQLLAQQRFLVPGFTYRGATAPVYEQQQTQQSIANVVYEKKQPQSLLDSYVPSVLQIEYYKQLQQQQQNALPTEVKTSANY
ncbi:hypothetical protein CBL_01032 [Carabus blaptoides fortunei]